MSDNPREASSTKAVEKEMKSFIIHQIGDWEKLKYLIRCLAEENSMQRDHLRKEQIKLFVLISEVFQYQIIEYLPLIFNVLLKKIEKEKVLNGIADTMQLIFYHSFRSPDYSIEYEAALLDILAKLFEIVSRPVKEVQIGASIAILRLIQLDNINQFHSVYDATVKGVFTEIPKAHSKILANLLECLLFLNKAFTEIPPVGVVNMAKYIASNMITHGSAKVRKIAVDNIFLLVILHSDALQKDLDFISEAVLQVKADKDKAVRESAMNCLNALKNLLGDDFSVQHYSHGKSVVAIKREEANEQKNSGKKIQSQGRPKKVEDQPFRSSCSIIPPPQREESKRKSVERKPIKEQILNPEFKKSIKEGVSIYVNYPVDERGELANPFGEVEEDGSNDGPQRPNQDNDGQGMEEHENENDESYDEPKESVNKDLLAQQSSNQVNLDMNDLVDQGEYNIEINPQDMNTSRTDINTARDDIPYEELEYRPSENQPFQQTPPQLKPMNPSSGHFNLTLGKNNSGDHDPEVADFYHNESMAENHVLKSELLQHEQIIDFQNKRIESLMNQINNLTTNLNIVLNKAATLEQNVFQLNYQTPGAQMGLPYPPGHFTYMPYNVQVPRLPNLGSFQQGSIDLGNFSSGTPNFSPVLAGLLSGQSTQRNNLMAHQLSFQNSFGGGGNINIQMPEIELARQQLAQTSQELSEWQIKRAEEQNKLKEKINKINKEKEVLGKQPEQKGVLPKREKLAEKITQVVGGTGSSISVDRPSQEDSLERPNQANFSSGGQVNSRQQTQFPNAHGDDMRRPPTGSTIPRDDQSARALEMKSRAIKIMNITLARILQDNEYRRLLDFLSDKENMKNFAQIDQDNLIMLVPKITDMLSYKAEMYIEECIPWINKLLETRELVSPKASEDLLYVVKQVLMTDKKRKMYQALTVTKLQTLVQDLEAYADSFRPRRTLF